MIRLTVLGEAGLSLGDGRDIEPVLRQPKRLALLAYLALAPRSFRQRDAVLAAFWPESGAGPANGALNAATCFLRQRLGAESIVSRPGVIGISAEHVWCDATEFRRLAGQDPEAALRLYKGDLLPAFFVDAGHAFDEWLHGERESLRTEAAAAARFAAEEAERAGDIEGALHWARRRVELSDDSEVAVRGVMALYARAGDRSGAVAAYERFAIRSAQEDRGFSPSPETRALLDSILAEPASGSPVWDVHMGRTPVRVVIPALPAGSPAVAAQLPDEPGDSPQAHAHGAAAGKESAGESRSLVWRLVHAAPVAAAAVAAFGLISTQWGYSRARGEAPRRPRLAVATLAAPGGSSETVPVASAITAAMVGRLTRAPALDVITTGTGTERVSPRTADFVVGGAVVRTGSRMRFNLQITDAHSGAALQTASFDASAGDALSFVDTVAERAEALVRATIGRQMRLRRLSIAVGNAGLYTLVQEADADREHAAELERSGRLAASARALDDADATLARVERAAPGSADVRITRAGVLRSLAITYLVPPLRDVPRAAALLERSIDEAARAVALDPSDATAAAALGSLGHLYWLVVPLPRDSARVVAAGAERSLRRAVLLDPSRPAAWNSLSALLFTRGDYAGAYVAARHAYDTDTYAEHSAEILDRLFHSSYEIGDDSAAARWCTEMGDRMPGSWIAADCQLSFLAWTGAADGRAVARAWTSAATGVRAADADSTVTPRLEMLVAAVLARAGLHDSAAAVAARARGRGADSPELLPQEAHMRLLLGDQTSAAELLDRYAATAPLYRTGVVRSRRFAALHVLPSRASPPR